MYSSPVCGAPLGSSDHCVISWKPLDSYATPIRSHTHKKCKLRRYAKSSLGAFVRWVNQHHWFKRPEDLASVDTMVTSFTRDLTEARDTFFPTKSVKIHHSDRPWMTSSIKQLILERQRAYHNGLVEQWRGLKNRVCKVICERKKSYYRDKVQHLKTSNPRKWWNTINKISGKSSNKSSICYEDENGDMLSGAKLAERLNIFYISVTADLPPLDISKLPAYLPAHEQLPSICPLQVSKKLSSLATHKAIGPDDVSNHLLKNFAPELAQPITDIFNASFSSGCFPTPWKDSFIAPIAKVSPVSCDGDLRPIALTSCVSKIQEDFAVRWLIDDVQHLIDPQQFGCLKGTSSTFCLLDMLENWLSSLDQAGSYLRVCYLDFSKAFDHIDHNILVVKLLQLGVRRSLVQWICSFLSGRRQAVKLERFISKWEFTHAGVPQGTKLGPILFLVMLNDLAIKFPLMSFHWKYVDDVTISEVISTGNSSGMQHDLDLIMNWAQVNNMNLNPKKCKEMVICPLKSIPDIAPLTVNGLPLEKVITCKLLGVLISETLKWNENTQEIVTKASKRLYILRVLKRSGIPPHDLVHIYYALVRSVLEYCCAIWSTSIPRYLKDKIEMFRNVL